jgi:hypothetical protein
MKINAEILWRSFGNDGWWGWNGKRGPFAERWLKEIRTMFFFRWLRVARRANGKAPQKKIAHGFKGNA